MKHYNARGDVTAETNNAGSLTYQAAYEAFGRHNPAQIGYATHAQEWGAISDRQRANTKDEDPTGLLNEGFRYRDLDTGTFITRDPLGFVDGPNQYTYVVQNPWTKFDPEGLYGQDFHYAAMYYILRSKNYSQEMAYSIASFSQYVDDSSLTEPIYAFGETRSKYHFPGSNKTEATKRANKEATSALADAVNAFKGNMDSENAQSDLGTAMHIFADSFSHEGFSGYWDSEKNKREGSVFRPNIGHADAPDGGHQPDYPFKDVDKAVDAAMAIYDALPEGTAKEGTTQSREEVEKVLRKMFSYENKDESARVKNIQNETKKIFKKDSIKPYKKDGPDKKRQDKRKKLEKISGSIISKASPYI